MLGIPFPAHILGSMLRWRLACPVFSKKSGKGVYVVVKSARVGKPGKYGMHGADKTR